jgi:uncharacterized Zn finger protein
MDYDWGFRPYVSVAERQRNALREMAALKKKGQTISPVVIEGRMIAKTFWGKSWCENLERYSDYSNRLPRGRTYARNGSVIDLQIAPGEIRAMVSGSDIYTVTVKVIPVTKVRWQAICKDCAGAIDSLIELLQGRLSKGVMERIYQQKTGLFPSPAEIKFSCSCPDWAGMCKHVAAVLYGIGARIDREPELLFRLHQVDEKELIAGAGAALPLDQKADGKKVLAGEDLSGLFGLDMAEEIEADSGAAGKKAAAKPAPAKNTVAPAKKTAVPAKKVAARKTKAGASELRKSGVGKKAAGGRRSGRPVKKK